MDDPLRNDDDDQDGGGLGPFPPPPLGLEADPFFAFRDELVHLCQSASLQLSALVSSSSSSSSLVQDIALFRSTTEATLGESIAHLERVIVHVERNPADFLLPAAELSARRAFLTKVQRHFAKLQRDVASLLQQKQQHEQQRQRQQQQEEEEERRRRAPAPPQRRRDEQTGSEYSRRYRQEQQQQQQDESLEEISSTLGRLKHVGTQVYHEIEAQSVLLDEMQGDADEVEGKMSSAMNRLDKILHTSSRGHTCAIVFLVCFLVGEIMLVVIL